MSTTRYLHNGLATGLNDGTTQANAWQSLADAAAGVAADDLVLSYDGGSGETLASAVTLATSGTASQRIIWRATNASFVQDGTRYLVDGNSAVANCIVSTGKNYQTWDGFDCTGATSTGFYQNTGNNYIHINCRYYSNGGRGLRASGIETLAYRCQFYSNSVYGAELTGSWSNFQFCVSHSNAADGFKVSLYATYYRCLAYNNTGSGYYMFGDNTAIGCIADDNGDDGFETYNSGAVLINCITTNNTNWGVSGATVETKSVSTAFYNNGSGEYQTTSWAEVETKITLSGDPYANQAGRDYTLTIDDTELVGLERILDTNNSSFETIGTIPDYPSASVPTFAGFTGSQMVSDGSLRISWTAGTGATRYDVFVSTSAITYAAGELAGSVNFGINEITVFQTGAGTPLAPGTTYYYGVKALKIGTNAYDTNTVTGSYVCVGRGTAPQYIKNIAGG